MKRKLEEKSYSKTPFENIALALSGGGFRSACYCLGVLSYLNKIVVDEHVDTVLLKKVTFISTTSGGTIPGAYYAFCNHRGIDFQNFFEKIYVFLRGEELLNDALNILKTDANWTGEKKKRNIINSFAKVYDGEKLFNGALFETFWDRSNTHLDEICFNTTEFFSGVSFKFQTDGSDDLTTPIHIGNYIVRVENSKEALNYIKQIKLSDVLAASSCFPLGFEPIIYPYDFAHKGLSAEDLKEAINIEGQSEDEREIHFIQEKTFGIMDGGITDNQGLNSLMEADLNRQRNSENKLGKKSRFDLIIVNDVASHYMEHYALPDKPKSSFWGKFSLRCIQWFFKTSMLVFLSGIVLGTFIWYRSSGSINSYFLIVLILQAIFSLLLFSFYEAMKKMFIPNKRRVNNEYKQITFDTKKGFTKRTWDKLYEYIKKVDLDTIHQMLFARLNSVVILNSDVFLKHIRRLIYDRFYTNTCWHYRRISNHVYELSYTNTKHRLNRWIQKKNPEDELISLEDFNELACNDELKRVAQNAFRTPTTLWFDEERRSNKSMESLIACGQFTTCHNLLKYIFRLESEKANLFYSLDEKYQSRILFIKKQLLVDWKRFQDDPFWQLNQIGETIDGYTHIDASMIKYPKS